MQGQEFKLSDAHWSILFTEADIPDKPVFAQGSISQIADDVEYKYDTFKNFSFKENTDVEELSSFTDAIFAIGYVTNRIFHVSREAF